MSRTPTWPTALISGGGSGIGLRLAEILRSQGTALAICDLTITDQALSRLRGGGQPDVTFHEVDVADGPAVEAAVRDAVEAVGPPALAINSAGINLSRPFDELTEEQFRRVVEINLIGSRNFAAAVLPHQRSGAQLGLIASLAGIVPNYGYAAYSASKFGVMGLAGCLRLEYAPRGIDVCVVCPPEVETPMVEEERRTGSEIGLELKKFSGTLEVDEACEEILAGLQARRTTIVPGRRARLTHRLARFVPGLANRVSDRMVRRTLGGR
ncbi:MAG: SDR family NAD(P)-dependent oxidoreductase [Solirubrobacterales bacterium]